MKRFIEPAANQNNSMIIKGDKYALAKLPKRTASFLLGLGILGSAWLTGSLSEDCSPERIAELRAQIELQERMLVDMADGEVAVQAIAEYMGPVNKRPGLFDYSVGQAVCGSAVVVETIVPDRVEALIFRSTYTNATNNTMPVYQNDPAVGGGLPLSPQNQTN